MFNICRYCFHDIFGPFSNAVTTCYGLFAHNERRSVYPWRNFSLLLVTSSSATGAPLKGSRTVTLKSLGLVEGKHHYPPIRAFYRFHPREQGPSSGGVTNEDCLGNTT
jgi:hypothetical protein